LSICFGVFMLSSRSPKQDQNDLSKRRTDLHIYGIDSQSLNVSSHR
jgi:hypothetical protein